LDPTRAGGRRLSPGGLRQGETADQTAEQAGREQDRRPGLRISLRPENIHLGKRSSGMTFSTGATGAGISQVPRKTTVPTTINAIAIASNLETFFILAVPASLWKFYQFR
jgi:hypothetical protein